ncbi:diguanylate cyclase [Bosea sp. 2YAB26]|uniref:GGDEF domain-containing protein n=1 Tax=Bosea sp. 2YAB26 TaxID=3237478 RepID=UPI003F92C9CA
MDLPTLWYLTVGTSLVAAAMTLWERKAHAQRSRPLGIWAAGYVAFAIGCLLAMRREAFPGITGPALTNIVMVLGYLLVLQGVRCLDERVRIGRCAAVLIVLAAAWAIGGEEFPVFFWTYVGSLPIAAICGLTALVLLRSRAVKPLRSRPIAVGVFVCHGLFYFLRATVAPVLVTTYGESLLPVLAKVTMYEAVLFTVAMPMALMALIREEYQAQLLADSRTDFLTGLRNRQGFFEHGARALRDGAAQRPVSMLAFDLDHFKAINDRYGHDAGDAVLRLFAAVSRDIAGANGVIGRLGGEEFAILLPGLDSMAASRIGETVAREFAERAARSDGLQMTATVSIGLAEAASNATALAELLSAADLALYKAKALGRNRIQIAAAKGVSEAA